MRKAARYWIVLATLCALLTGCVQSASADTPPYYAFTDSAGTRVTLTHKPEKVAVLFSSFAEVWALAGGQTAITVGESIERGFAPQDAQLVDEGAGKSINLEALIAAQPDFVILSADIAAQAQAAQALAQAGIAAAQFRVESFDDYLAMLRICCDITGNETAYQENGAAVEAQVKTLLDKAAQSELPEKKILLIRAGSGYDATKAKGTQDHFVCAMLAQLGAINIADSAPVLLDGLSFESILQEDPDYIFFSAMGKQDAAEAYVHTLLAQESWQSLRAIRQGQYTFLPKDLFHYKPNAKWAQAYQTLIELLWPGLMTQ